VQGFLGLFADDGDINAGTMNFRGEQLGWLVVFLAKFAPDIHRELNRVVVQDNTVSVELAIRGTFTEPYESPAGAFSRTEPDSTFPALTSGSCRRQDQAVQLPRKREHLARTNGRAARLRVRDQSTGSRGPRQNREGRSAWPAVTRTRRR
jgi:hypothetical protein